MPVIEEVLRVEECAAIRRELAGQVFGEWRGRDDVAADRQDPATQARDEAVGVAVGRDEDLAGLDPPARRFDHEFLLSGAAQGDGSCSFVEARARALRRGHEPGEPLAWVENAGTGGEERSVIRRAADLRHDVSLGDDRRGNAGRLQAALRLLEVMQVGRGIRELEVPALPKLAVDLLVRDHLLEELVPVERLAVQGAAPLPAIAAHELGRTPLVARMDNAAVARRRAPAERARLDEHDARALLGETPRRRDARVPPAHDHDVGPIRELAPTPIGQRWHRRVPIWPPFVLAVHRRCRHTAERNEAPTDTRNRSAERMNRQASGATYARRPAATVSSTRPGSSRPSSGVFFPLEARADDSTSQRS